MKFAALLLSLPILYAGEIPLSGLRQPVEILRDRWGVPHIYAQNEHDLFFAQGYVTARDRLFQIDLWKRIGAGHLAEVLGPRALERDRLARSVRFRGDWNAEWQSYGPNTRAIVTAFTDGINAYIHSLNGHWPLEFRAAGYGPASWVPEDCVARVAGLLMTRNLTKEVARAEDVRRFGLATVEKLMPPDPHVAMEVPKGLDLADISPEIVKVYNEAIGPVRFAEQGSNNWVVDGAMTVTGKPILANDPHRPVQIPSLRKTVHLVAPGWNAIGAGEPALPGIALGHNQRIAFGFTIVGVDQVDLYVETLNPANPNQYRYQGAWKNMEVEHEQIRVKGMAQPKTVDLRYTLHGPVIHVDPVRHRAYALRWVGSEPGSAGYLAGLSLARAQNWNEFLSAVERYKVPSENIVYADVDGNIGWHATGMAPIRKGWSGLFPVPGTGEYEWAGFRKMSELPWVFNPPSHMVATANHNILPAGYSVPLGYEWALPFRYHRIVEMLGGGKFSVRDFEKMQQDVTSLPARRFQRILKAWNPKSDVAAELLAWDTRLTTNSRAAAIYEFWITRLPAKVFGADLGPKIDLEMLLKTLEQQPNPKALEASLAEALADLKSRLGADRSEWTWGRIHQIYFRHPLDQAAYNRGPISRPGDGNTVNSTSGTQFQQTNGASYREVLDTSDWDRSTMTNVPGESGDPASPHYSDLLDDWAAGRYHPMPYTRKAVEAATTQRMHLVPAHDAHTQSAAVR